MKSRFLVLLGILMMPVGAKAIVTTLDVPGTIQAGIEVGNTANNVQEGVSQVKQYQKTMAAIGTAIKTVSDYVTNQKEKLQKKLEKVQKYKEEAEEYKAKAESYAAKAKAAYEVGKAAASGDVAGAVSSMGGISPELDKLQSTAQKGLEAKDKAVEYKKQAEESLEMAKEAGAAIQNKANGTAANAGIGDKDVSDQAEMSQTISQPKAETAKLAEMPSAMPTRRPIEVSAASEAVSPEAVASESLISEQIQTAETVKGAVENNSLTGAEKTLSETSESETADAKISESETTDAKNAMISLDAASEKTAKLVKVREIQKKERSLTEQASEKNASIKSSRLEGENVMMKVDSLQQMEKEKVKTESFEKIKEAPAAPIQHRPTRATFKTSVGYGQMKVSYPLAFANSVSIKSGTTEDGVLIVPENLSLACSSLSYEQAAEKDAMAACLRKTNDINYSKQSDEITADDRQDAHNDISNGYAEYLASAYFEALNIYNESLTFKNNVVDPVKTAETPDVQSAWIYAKEMNRIVGTRINALNKLWSRALSIDAYRRYTEDGLRNRAK